VVAKQVTTSSVEVINTRTNRDKNKLFTFYPESLS